MSEEKADYLKRLNVTAAELAELKGTWKVAGGLSERSQAILRAARMAGDILLCWNVDEFYLTSLDDILSSGRCYRLRPDLELPPPEPAKREGNRPFLHTVDGAEVWCCPVFPRKICGLTELRFLLPSSDASFWVSRAAGLREFLGAMTSDENGWPKDWIRHNGVIERNMGMLAGWHLLPLIAYVCFRKD